MTGGGGVGGKSHSRHFDYDNRFDCTFYLYVYYYNNNINDRYAIYIPVYRTVIIVCVCVCVIPLLGHLQRHRDSIN